MSANERNENEFHNWQTTSRKTTADIEREIEAVQRYGDVRCAMHMQWMT